MYKIILSDNTTLTDLNKNGDNFIANFYITEDVFKNKLSPVTIIDEDEDTEETHEHMKLLQLKPYGNSYWFVLADITPEELNQMKIRADIDYLAMMTDVEL